jgi:hypothetical protein
MAHPRAQFPDGVIAYYQAHGGKACERAYRCGWQTLRRWLRERGVPIRPQGVRL